MMTLLKSATNGWLDYTQHGKYAASSIWGIACGKAKQQGTVGSSRCSIYMRC